MAKKNKNIGDIENVDSMINNDIENTDSVINNDIDDNDNINIDNSIQYEVDSSGDINNVSDDEIIDTTSDVNDNTLINDTEFNNIIITTENDNSDIKTENNIIDINNLTKSELRFYQRTGIIPIRK